MVSGDAFDEIVRENPDLAEGGPETITVRLGGEIASMPWDEYESLSTAIGEALVAGGDFHTVLEPVWVLPVVMRLHVAYASYRYAVLHAFHLPLSEGSVALERAGIFLRIVNLIREGEGNV